MSIRTKILGILKLLKWDTKVYLPIGKKKDIIIYDDFFPNPVTGFRIDEFGHLLQQFSSSKVVVDSKLCYNSFGFNESQRNLDIEKYLNQQGWSLSEDRVKLAGKFNYFNARIIYLVFYFNILRIFKFLEILKLPYIITLYPGGGFRMNDNNIDQNLKRVLGHNLCKAVIVNQRYTRDYLLQKNICAEEKIHLIFGLPVDEKKLHFDFNNKLNYPLQRSDLDICFVGAKYSPMGKDKGYDLFIASAETLSKHYSHCRFHVIGGFSEKDLPVEKLNNKITFYGKIPADQLAQYLQKFDIIVAPNRAGILGKGSFDGFPVGCCVEASLAGCVMVTTDPTNENTWYKNGEEIIIVQACKDNIVEQLKLLIENPEKISLIGKAGMNRTKILYSKENQLDNRVRIIETCLNKLN